MPEIPSHPAPPISESHEVPVLAPIRKSLWVHASAAHAFGAFTCEMDSWWPGSRPAGNNSPVNHIVVEREVLGAVYAVQQDHSRLRWGTVLVWEPPCRFVMAWQVSPAWKFEPDLSRCSVVEVTFRQMDDGLTTLVELEHRGLERHHAASDTCPMEHLASSTNHRPKCATRVLQDHGVSHE